MRARKLPLNVGEKQEIKVGGIYAEKMTLQLPMAP